MRHAPFQVLYRHHAVIPTTRCWRYYNYLHLIMRKLAQGHLASKQQTFDPLIFLPLLEGLNGGRTYWKVCRLLVCPRDLALSIVLRSPPARACWWSTKRLLSLLYTLLGDLLCAGRYARNAKALKMDLESEVRTGKDFPSGVNRRREEWSRLHVEAESWLDVGLLTPAFGLCASVCLLGRKVWEAAEWRSWEFWSLSDGDSQQSPQGSPSLHAKPHRALAAGPRYLITFWRLIQRSGSITCQGQGLFGASSFAFPEEAGMNPRKNCWRGISITLTSTIARPSIGMASRPHLVGQT